MADVDGLSYVMTFSGNTKEFDAAIDHMTARINGLAKVAASVGLPTVARGGGPGGGSGGGGGGGSRGRMIGPQQESWSQYESRIRRETRERDRIERSERGKLTGNPKQETFAQQSTRMKREAREIQDAMFGPKKPTYADMDRMAAWSKARAREDSKASLARERADEKEKNRIKRNMEKGSLHDERDPFFSRGSAMIIGAEFNKAQTFAEDMASAAWSAVEAFGQMYAKSVDEAAAFQDIESGLKFAFGQNNYERIFENVKTEAAKTSFTLAEVADLTRSLGMMKINPFEDASGKALEFKSRTGELISTLEVLQDAASATGKSTKSVQVALREFMGGNDTSLARRLDIPLTKVHEWRAETKKAKTEQEQAQILFQKLAGMYGGASRGRADNWNFLKDQIPDLTQQIFAAMGAGALKAMTPGLKEFMEGLRKLVGSERSMKALAEGFTAVGRALGLIMRMGGKFIEFSKNVMEMTPHLPLFALGLTGIAVAAVGTTAAVTALALAVGGVAAAVMAVGVGITAMALVPTLVAAGAAATVFAAGASLMTGAFVSSQQKASGFLETMTDAKVMITALAEAFQSWGDGKYRISLDSFEALGKRGLTGYFQELVAWAARAEQYVKGFTRGFSDGMGPSVDRVGQTFDKLIDNITRVLSALGLIAPSAETSMDSAGSSGERFGRRVASAVSLILDVVDSLNGKFANAFGDMPGVITQLGEMYTYVKVIWNVFQIMGTAVAMVGSTIFNMLYLPLQMVVRMALGVGEAIGNAAAAAAKLASGDFKGAGEAAMAAGKAIPNAAMDGFAEFGNFASNQAGRAASIVGNVGDIMNAGDHQKSFDEFASQMSKSLVEIDDRRAKEEFNTKRREALAAPEVGYTRNPGEAMFSGEMFSQMSWGDRGVNPMVQQAEAVRQQQTINITVPMTLDSNKIAEGMMSITSDAAMFSGSPMTSVPQSR